MKRFLIGALILVCSTSVFARPSNVETMTQKSISDIVTTLRYVGEAEACFHGVVDSGKVGSILSFEINRVLRAIKNDGIDFEIKNSNLMTIPALTNSFKPDVIRCLTLKSLD